MTVESATWNETRHLWCVRLDDRTIDECHVVISGVGFLNVPRYPDWPGLDEFAGPKFHTARWEPQHDLSGKIVAVVGTGSSATQVVPALQPTVRKLYVFQRGNWIYTVLTRCLGRVSETTRRPRHGVDREAAGKPQHRPNIDPST